MNIDKIIAIIRNLNEEAVTNNASSGNIAGLPPDQPPGKRKKKYIFMRNSRKLWQDK